MMVLLILLLQLAAPYKTPHQFFRWWNEVAVCAGYTAPESKLDSIEFWHVNAESFLAEGMPATTAYAYVKYNQIFVITAKMYDEKYIKHEMLHFILYWHRPGYQGGHPIEYEKCDLLIREKI
jgi:hypothetical protein